MKFKSILAWVKSHLVIVISVLLALALLPTAFYFSNSWNKKILAKQEKDGGAELAAVDGVKVGYVFPQYDAKTPAFTHTSPPNAEITKLIQSRKEAAAAQVAAVTKEFIEFNRGVGAQAAAVGRSEHTPLVAGLFPVVAMSPEDAGNAGVARDKEQAKLNEAEDKFIGKRGNANPYQAMLASVNAGDPVDNNRLKQVLGDAKAREEEKLTQGKRKLEPDEEAKLKDQLKALRIGEYQRRAQGVGLYANMDVFPVPETDTNKRPPGRTSPVPTAANAGGPDFMPDEAFIPAGIIRRADLTRPKLFMHQWDLWVLQDVFAAVRLVNKGADGKLLPVDKATVKRIDSIALHNPEKMLTLDPKPKVEDEFASAPTPEAAPAETTPGITALDLNVSVTGRTRGAWNKYYEVRRCDLTCVVASARLQQFLAAIARVNLMSVTDLDIEAEIDPWEDLNQGYYYGDEHVVRVHVSIESLWLKSWIVPMMPSEVQTSLGIAQPTADAGTPASTPAAEGSRG